MNKTKIIIFSLVLLAVLLPAISFAQVPLAPPCGADGCNFQHFLQLAKNIINFSIFWLAIPIAALSFAFAGIMLVVSPGNETRRGEAKQVFYYAFIGLVIALSSWLIVDTILDTLVGDNDRREEIENIRSGT